MKVFLLFTIILFTVTQITAQNTAPEVTNVTFNQRTDGSFIVDVTYDLNDADGDTMFVTMEVSEDSGTTWNFTCESIGGDVGSEILSGAGKHIVWDFGAEHPETFGDAFRIKIIADDRPLITGTVTDIDGNVYQTVKIGSQWWMAENLKVTHYINGTAIPNITDNSQWSYPPIGAYCNYNNDTTNVATYGRLYNWYAVDYGSGNGLPPVGWHVPSNTEWQTLVDYLGGAPVAGGKMKTIGTIQGSDGLWNSPNTGATNSSGFSALPGGSRSGYDGLFGGISNYTTFWSSTDEPNVFAWIRILAYNYSGVYHTYVPMADGYSVRCVRD